MFSVWSDSFTISEDTNYGPYLESVNGLAGNDHDRTYWELLVRTPDDQFIRPNVGQFSVIVPLIRAVFLVSNSLLDLISRYRMLYSKPKGSNHPELYKMVKKQQQ